MPDTVQDHPLFRISALLTGIDGTTARCCVEMWHEQSSTGKTYTRCRIIGDPPELPDGDYMVDFAEQSVRTQKYQGKWQLVFLAPDADVIDSGTDAA